MAKSWSLHSEEREMEERHHLCLREQVLLHNLAKEMKHKCVCVCMCVNVVLSTIEYLSDTMPMNNNSFSREAVL